MPEYNYITEQIFTVSEFFTPDECDAYVALAETAGFSHAPINTAFGPQIQKDVRNNTRVIIDDFDRATDRNDRLPPHESPRNDSCPSQFVN